MIPIAELHRRLDTALAYGPSYGPGYSNHLPMALQAGWALGADAARLDAQIEHDGEWLEPAPASAGAPPDDWRELLGRRDAYARLRPMFAAAIKARGAEAVLRESLPLLISSPHAGLFHGAIRTAHAWESGHAGELAAALATWAASWNTLPDGAPGSVATLGMEAWSNVLTARAAAPANRLRGERLVDVAQGDAYAALCDALVPAPHWLARREQLISLALDGYLASRNFIVLHLITGLRALRVLAPRVPDWPDVQVWITRAFAAAWLAAGMAPTQRAQSSAPPDWPALKHAALAQLDDHALKLAHACWQEDALSSDERWRAAAALGLGL